MNKSDIGKVILRAVVGLTFFIHGLSKFQGGISNTAGFFESLGIPGFIAYVTAAVELVGGIALILGLGTRIVTSLFALIMIGAIFTAKLSVGFLGNGQMAGFELELVLLAVSIYFVFAEKSKISLDQMFFQS
ncbi:MAG TPA: DoxX family protein [Neobacillus sp.]